ncbi:MAG TPA: hypothetical protein VLD62_13260 [Acidimicrobiia bacterium]|nr:hypothetical protein [Acidimicrobiia bacterium]
MTLLLVHAGATLVLAGLIWTVQVVHYPLFDGVGADRFTEYEARHASSIGRLLVVPAGIEVVAAGWLAVDPPDGVPPWLILSSGALLFAVWVVTVLVQVPTHRRLSSGFDPDVHRRLVVSNWWRTGAWTVRGIVALVMIGLAGT